MIEFFRCLGLLVLFTALSSGCGSLWAEAEAISIPRVSRPPRLEDFLRNTARQAETAVTDFRQFDPRDGDPVSQPTTAFLSYDDKNLYVGWICRDDPQQIRAHLLKRDNLMTEDRVSISLDTFHDHHRSYFFDVNPYGIQMDGVTIDGKDDLSYDTLWHAEGKLTADGYVILQTIPLKSLRFSNVPVQEWGFVLNRMIMRNNEMSCWPYVTRRIQGWSTQFAHLQGIENVSQGRNWQFIPYGLFSRSRYLEFPPATGPFYRTENQLRLGLDSKLILKDALTLDMALNPDFSQVESDEPQVTVNQRYEVFFPEKRPFFIENANYFETPEQLFFSRRIVDPQFGMRLTGKMGRWGVGLLAADDHAPGETAAENSPLHGDRAGIGMFRLMREFANQSRIGILVTSRDWASSHNRVYAVDARLKLNPNWTFSGQAIGSQSRETDTRPIDGSALLARISHSGKHWFFSSEYKDHSPDFRADLGYIPRVDIRQNSTQLRYRWRPEKSKFISFGPVLGGTVVYDHAGRLQDWELEPEFHIELTRMTNMVIEHSTALENYQGKEFRPRHTRAALESEILRWMAVSISGSRGTRINYYPAAGRQSSLADSTDAEVGLTLRPMPQFILQTDYLLSRLTDPQDGQNRRERKGVIFNNHIFRSKANYQFNPVMSLRAILDYNMVQSDLELVSLSRSKRFGADILFTYLLNPWTALYAGYTDQYEGWRHDPHLPPYLTYRSGFPQYSTGRQFFVKWSYLWRM